MKRDRYVFSCLSGYNIYTQSDDQAHPWVHLFSSEQVNFRELPQSGDGDRAAEREKWRAFIEYPVDIRQFLWPVDLVELPENNRLAWVFKERPMPKRRPIKDLLYLPPSRLGWKNERVMRTVRSLLTAFGELHAGGYVYHAFDIRTIYVEDKTDEVVVDFSHAMARHLFRADHRDIVYKDDVLIEYQPPWADYLEKPIAVSSLYDDYYSIAAMLFKLMVGLLPYQGKSTGGYYNRLRNPLNDDSVYYEQMMRQYFLRDAPDSAGSRGKERAIPVFVFDPDDDSNAIGEFSEDELLTERWEELPGEIREMFLKTFSKDNSRLAPERRTLYSAGEWLSALQRANLIL